MTELLQQMAFRESTLERDEDGTAWHDSFAALVERQSAFVFRIAYSVLRNHYDSDDVVQETFLKLYRTRKWEGINNERAFLARAAWRTAVDRLPKVKVGILGSDLPSNCDDPERAIITADWNATVHRLIDALPEDLRQPIALSTVEELKSHEIAAIMGIPEGTVRSRLSRARQILKQKLGALKAGPHEQ